MTDIPTNHNGQSNEQTDRFTDSSINRRTFVRLSAATGAALALPGNASASVSSEKMETEYEYVLNHTATDYAVPTLVTFTDETGPEDLKSVIEGEVITTTEPQPAAYTQLTTTEAQTAADLPTAETLSHSPGSNPFWRLGYYPFGVFPEPRRSTGFIDYEQMIDGLNHLESQHSDRLNVYSIGKSPGHYNYLTDREDPKELYVAEVTNDIADEAAFREKTKIMYSLSIHGLERAGAEAGSRFIEGLLRGNETNTAQLLDDLVLVFVYPNPDGWVAKHPQYESGWQLAGPEGGAPVIPFYERGTAEVYDTNRQYPTVGWIDPAEFPGEPTGANLTDDEPGIDDDVPDAIYEHVPDTLSFVEHFRNYENLEFGADLHGALHLPEFVLGLISQHQFSNDQFHKLYQLNREVDETLEAALETWTTIGDLQETLTGDTNIKVLYETLPEEAFDYGGIWDTIGYTDAGFFGDWMAHPKELGGLGLTSMDFEMAYSHMVGANVYDPELVRMQVLGYRTAIRTIAEYATKNVESFIDTAGDSVAYVTTDSLTRSSDDLSFIQNPNKGSSTTNGTNETSLTLDAGGVSTAEQTVADDVDELSVQVQPRPDTLVNVELRGPDGTTVRSFDLPEAGRSTGDLPEFAVNNPAAGTWTVAVTNILKSAGEATVVFGTLSSSGINPDPKEVLGYSQREYEVDPLVYFEDITGETTAAVDPLTVADVKGGTHLDYDHLVVIHDDAITDTGYIDALDEFVDSGGNLVVTDTGVQLLGPMTNDLAAGIDGKHIDSREDLYLGYIGVSPPSVAVTGGDSGNKNGDHPLLEDTREIQKQLYKIVPLGYNVGYEAPMTVIDPNAFKNANDTNTVATIAGRTSGANDWVGAGSLTHRGESPADDPGDGIHVIGGLLPPASQEHLHPFGLLDYTVSFFGQTVLVNALDATQIRKIDGEVVRTFGEADNFAVDAPPIPFSVSGSRSDDGSTFTAGQTDQIDIAVTPSDKSTVRDIVPTEWTVKTGFSDDVERVEQADGVKYVYFATQAAADEKTSYTYFVEAPDSTGSYEFGPIEVNPTIRDSWITVDSTTETNYVAGANTNA
ncbi:M14 family metallopeptidase [Haladaptatus halobius]|uniref:M14 family metallopeptidase n=1 Tax=Haladaptatus halobius TaxID=2884875 RepID=UPI001D0AAE56|nr:M14 family metallopeptidase [Haladaptatus halobius]